MPACVSYAIPDLCPTISLERDDAPLFSAIPHLLMASLCRVLGHRRACSPLQNDRFSDASLSLGWFPWGTALRPETAARKQKTDGPSVGKVGPRFLSCVLNIHRRRPGNSQTLCKPTATHVTRRVEVACDRLQPREPPNTHAAIGGIAHTSLPGDLHAIRLSSILRGLSISLSVSLPRSLSPYPFLALFKRSSVSYEAHSWQYRMSLPLIKIKKLTAP